jgi:uncharacterized protein YjbJ (UPF0337 family)
VTLPFARLNSGKGEGACNHRTTQGGTDMSATDKIKNLGQELEGKGKSAVGDVKGDHKLKAKGQADQTKGSLKQAGEKVKDAL